jgi:hypothetical protein
MGKMRYAAAILAMGLIAGALPLAAIEFGAEGCASDLFFPWVDTASSAAPSLSTWFWGGSAYVGLPIGDDAALKVTYERDPVLRNLVTAAVGFERGIAKIDVGPFVGFLNSAAAPFNLGLSTSIRFQWPGVAYVSARSDGAMAIGLLASNLAVEPQARAELSAGFYAKGAIVSGIVSSSRFSGTDTAGALYADTATRYLVTIDLFKKNVPYTLLSEAGYQLRSLYESGKTYSLGSVILGIAATVTPVQGFTVKAAMESDVFVFGQDALVGTTSALNDLFLFKANLGVSFDTDELPKIVTTR